MDFLLGFVCVFIWLLSSGWSFRVLSLDTDKDILVGVLCVCVLLAPLTVGVALAENVWPKFSKMKDIN